MDNKLKIHIASIGFVLLTALVVNATMGPQKQIMGYISAYGMLALAAVLFSTALPVITRIWNNEFTRALMANRRWIGIYSFLFALLHVVIAAHFLFNWNFGKMLENQMRAIGGVALVLLAAMTATSNDVSVRTLGKRWKTLQYIVYPAILLVAAHATGIGQIVLKSDTAKVVLGAALVLLVLGKLAYQYPVFKRKQPREI